MNTDKMFWKGNTNFYRH